MKIRNYSVFPLIVLTLLAALTFWLQYATRVDEGPTAGKARHDPDFFVDGFTLRKFNPQGMLEYTLVGQKMLHYADDDSTDVTLPQLAYFGRPQTMHLGAKRALVSKNGNEVVLIDDVRAVREASAQDPEVVMTTTELSVYPDQEFAATDKAVKIVQGKSVMNGVGMELDSKVQVYKLLSKAYGTVYRKQ